MQGWGVAWLTKILQQECFFILVNLTATSFLTALIFVNLCENITKQHCNSLVKLNLILKVAEVLTLSVTQLAL